MVADVNTPNIRPCRFTAMPDIMPVMDSYESEGKVSELTLERLKPYSADIVAIERKMIKNMERRERELKRMNTTQKAFALLSGLSGYTIFPLLKLIEGVVKNVVMYAETIHVKIFRF